MASSVVCPRSSWSESTWQFCNCYIEGVLTLFLLRSYTLIAFNCILFLLNNCFRTCILTHPVLYIPEMFFNYNSWIQSTSIKPLTTKCPAIEKKEHQDLILLPFSSSWDSLTVFQSFLQDGRTSTTYLFVQLRFVDVATNPTVPGLQQSIKK